MFVCCSPPPLSACRFFFFSLTLLTHFFLFLCIPPSLSLHSLPHRRTIQEILNRQTIHQFSSYARQQYPDSTELQQALISQLQEQHFQQYMQQMMEQSADLLDGTMLAAGGGGGAINNNSGNQQSNNHQQQEVETSTVAITMVDGSPVKTSSTATSEAATITLDASNPSLSNPNTHSFEDEEDEVSDEEEEEEEGDTSNSTGGGGPGGRSVISNASMWTRKDIATFKETIRAEGGDGILKVGHGEIATIRVPTHENGNCIFWEFATDSYDIGFGLLFEWNATPDHQVSIHISESEDEEDEEGKCFQFEIASSRLQFLISNSTQTVLPLFQKLKARPMTWKRAAAI